MPFCVVPRFITRESVKAPPAVEYEPSDDHGVNLDVSKAHPFVAPAWYVLVPSWENERAADPLFEFPRPVASGCVSKSNQTVGTRPVMSASAARAAGAQSARAARMGRRERFMEFSVRQPGDW